MRSALALLIVGATAVAPLAHAADASWPTKPVKIVVPYAPGGPADVTARLLAAELTKSLGQTFYVDNVPGASGKIALQQVASSRDNHTLLLNNTTGVVLSNFLDKERTYDVSRDLRGVATIANMPYFLVVNASLPVKDVRELVAYTRQHPGKVNYGSLGTGSAQFFLTETLKVKTGMDLTHIPYKGDTPASQDLVANTIQVYFMASGKRAEGDPKLRVLGVTAKDRWFNMPSTPTLGEAGIDDLLFYVSNGIFAPASMPDADVKRLNAAIEDALKSPAVRDKLTAIGYQMGGGPPQILEKRVQDDIRLFQDIVARGDIKLTE